MTQPLSPRVQALRGLADGVFESRGIVEQPVSVNIMVGLARCPALMREVAAGTDLRIYKNHAGAYAVSVSGKMQDGHIVFCEQVDAYDEPSVIALGERLALRIGAVLSPPKKAKPRRKR